MPKILCAPLALLVLALAGCGGDSKPSKEEYIADLDKVCRETNQKVQKVKQPRSVKAIGTFTRATRPILEDSIRQAEAIELPEEQGDEFKNYVQGSKQSLEELDAVQEAADANDVPGVRRALVKTARDNRKRDAQAKKLGLKQCGSG